MHCRIWCSSLVVMAVVVWSWDVHDARSNETKTGLLFPSFTVVFALDLPTLNHENTNL